jgi:hypothetical protein
LSGHHRFALQTPLVTPHLDAFFAQHRTYLLHHLP